MAAVAFDTLKFAQTLREKAKFSPEQAEGLAEAFAHASADQLATKGDVADLRSDVKADIANLRSEIKADLRELELRLEAKIETTKSDTLKWMFGTIGFQTIVILGAVLALSRFGH